MSCKHTFRYLSDPDNPYDHTSVEVSSTANELTKVIEAMEAYLLACGFMFPEGCHLGYEEDGVVMLNEQDGA